MTWWKVERVVKCVGDYLTRIIGIIIMAEFAIILGQAIVRISEAQ